MPGGTFFTYHPRVLWQIYHTWWFSREQLPIDTLASCSKFLSMMNIEPITFADIWTCDGRLKRETNRNFFEIPRLDLIAQPNTIGQAPSVLSTLGSLRNVRMKQSVKKPVVRGTRSVTNTESNMDSTAGKASNFQSTRFYLAFGSLCIAGLLTSMDSVIIAAALPKISEDLAATSEKSFWTGTGFLLSQAITPPLYGTLSESFGRKPCMLVALGLFTIATLFCATAQSIEWLIAARTVSARFCPQSKSSG